MPGQATTNEANQESCKLRCRNTVGCHFFTWNVHNHNCNLQNSGAANERISMSGVVSGQPNCIEPTNAHFQCHALQQSQCSGDCQWNGQRCGQNCFRSNLGYTGNMQGTSTTTEVNQEACKTRCHNTVGCEYFTYYPSNRHCNLQSAGVVRQSLPGAVSGERRCHNWWPGNWPGNGNGNNNGNGNGNNGGGVGGTESMPADVHGAMVVGQANSGFQGLSAVVSFAGTPLAQHGWCFGALAGVALLLAAFAYRRSVPGHVMSEGQMVALTAADEHAE